jgi:hypothetical protein
MRTVILLSIATLGIAALAYRSSVAADCARELSWCMSDPPLFVKLTGANVAAHCRGSFRACQARNGVMPAGTIATREAVNAGRAGAAPGQ